MGERFGFVAEARNLPAQVVRGGQEHDLFHDTVADRYFKVTRDGVFGFSPGIDLAMVTSQPRFEIVPVTQAEIDGWFQAQGFEKITACGYYRAEDNLGVFDAHAKNLVRFEDTLIPFDVIPCRPDGGFLKFIADTLAEGQTLSAVRTVSTSKQVLRTIMSTIGINSKPDDSKIELPGEPSQRTQD